VVEGSCSQRRIFALDKWKIACLRGFGFLTPRLVVWSPVRSVPSDTPLRRDARGSPPLGLALGQQGVLKEI
jgi:hypothetical protein